MRSGGATREVSGELTGTKKHGRVGRAEKGKCGGRKTAAPWWAQGRKEQMYSQRPDFTAMVKPLLAGTSKNVPAP